MNQAEREQWVAAIGYCDWFLENYLTPQEYFVAMEYLVHLNNLALLARSRHDPQQPEEEL